MCISSILASRHEATVNGGLTLSERQAGYGAAPCCLRRRGLPGGGRSSGLNSCHDLSHGPSDPFGCGFDITVRKMGVAQRHLHVGMTQQTRDHRHRYAVHDGMARHGMAQVVQTHILDPDLASDAIPEPKVRSARAGWIERRGKDEWAACARLPVENGSGLAAERHRPRSRLAVGKDKHVVLHFRPAEARNLALAAAGEQQKADDVGLLPAALPAGMPVERGMETTQFLPRQEACELRAPVECDGRCGIGFNVTAGDSEIQEICRSRARARLALPGAVWL